MVGQWHEGSVPSTEGIHEQNTAVARQGDEVAPTRRREVAAEWQHAARRRLVRRGGDHAWRILRQHGDQPLVGAEQLAGHALQRLGPRKPDPARERDDPSHAVHRVQRPVRPERGLLDGGGHRVEPPAGDVERHHVSLVRDREQELRLGIEADDPLHRRQLATNGPRQLRETGKAIGAQRSPFGGNADRQSWGAGAAARDRSTSCLFGLWLRRCCRLRPGPAAPERHTGKQEEPCADSQRASPHKID
jgi:hypothetical protein